MTFGKRGEGGGSKAREPGCRVGLVVFTSVAMDFDLHHLSIQGQSLVSLDSLRFSRREGYQKSGISHNFLSDCFRGYYDRMKDLTKDREYARRKGQMDDNDGKEETKKIQSVPGFLTALFGWGLVFVALLNKERERERQR